MEESSLWQKPPSELNKIHDAFQRVRTEMHKMIIGQDEMIDLMLAAIFAGGHVLLPALLTSGMPEFTLSLWVKEEGYTDDDGEAYLVTNSD